MTKRIWEIGTKGLDIDDFAEWMEEVPAAVIVDIRSSIVGWMGKGHLRGSWTALNLRLVFGERYLLFPSLRARNTEPPWELENQQKGVRALIDLMRDGWEPVLLGTNTAAHECHRDLVISALESGMKIEANRAMDKPKPTDLFS